MPPRKRKKPSPAVAIDRAAKRSEQKEAGVFDGRYRPRVVKSGKRYKRHPRHRGPTE